MKRTGWYRGDQKPVRVGPYERAYGDDIHVYCFYDGEAFSVAGESPEEAEDYRFTVSAHQNLPWRGLAKEPK